MYVRNRKISSMRAFEKTRANWFKLRDKTIHRAFLESMQYRTLNNFIKSGVLYTAKKVGDK